MHRVLFLALTSLFAFGCGSSLAHPATLTVNNYSDLAVCDVYLAESHQPGWGGDWLETEEEIMPGQSQAFALSAGRWNIRLDDCRGTPLFGRSNLIVRGGRAIDFRTVEVDRRRRWSRRFARSKSPASM